MQVDVSNLREALPEYDTMDLFGQWMGVCHVFEREDEMDIPCTMNMGVRRILFQTVRAMEAKTVLDIGTYLGTSALAFALAVHPLGGRVVSVDLKDVNDNEAYWKEQHRPGSPRDLAERCGVSYNIDFVAMDSVAFLTHSQRRFDFICLDGWHEEEAVYKEIPLAIALLNPGGLIFLDDVQLHGAPPGLDTIPGPLNALRRHRLEGLEVETHFISRTLEGEPVAVAFLTRKPSDAVA